VSCRKRTAVEEASVADVGTTRAAAALNGIQVVGEVESDILASLCRLRGGCRGA